MKSLTLRQLRYFDALARHGHFGQAAAACAISQPALSLQIRDLEDGLGAPLFERAARRVRLTPFGEAFVARARDILARVDDLGDLARAAALEFSGQLRLGIIPTIAPYLLPRLVAALETAYPALGLDIRETVTSRLLEELADGRLDTAILALPVSETTLTEVALFTETFVLVRPSSEAKAPVPRPEELARMRLLLLEEGHCFRDQALDFCNLPAGVPRAGLDGSSLTTLVQMVGAGLGVTVVPEIAVGIETRTAPVAVARFAEPAPSRTVGMVWRRTSPLAARLEHVADVVRGLAPRPAGAT